MLEAGDIVKSSEAKLYPKFLGSFGKCHHPSLALLDRFDDNQKSGINSPVELGSWNPVIYKVLYIQSGCFGFLNHQQ